MLAQNYDTIIVGGGVAGLACAKKLSEQNKEFLLITEDIGGKILTSKSGVTNYGAYFVLNNYHNILPYVKKKEKLYPVFVGFHSRTGKSYPLIRMMKYPFQTLRFLSLLMMFKGKYAQFERKCLVRSQKEVIESEDYFKSLYYQTAEEFVHEKKNKKIAKEFLSEGTYMCTFQPLNRISTFDFLRLCLALIVPAYEFQFLKEKLISTFSDKILIDSVKSIKDKTVRTRKGSIFKAHNVVIATPPQVSKDLLGLKKMKSPVNSVAFHLKGILKKESGQFALFPSSSEVIFIRKQEDGSYLFYSKTKSIDLRKYFKNPRIIAVKEWKPAFHLQGDILWDCDLGNNVYLIGDHNLIGLETSFITGVYAANKIVATSFNR